MVEVELRRHQLVEDGERLVVDHRAALLDHHLPLRRHLRVDQLQVAHAVGFMTIAVFRCSFGSRWK
jgi:hypothetical protein